MTEPIRVYRYNRPDEFLTLDGYDEGCLHEFLTSKGWTRDNVPDDLLKEVENYSGFHLSNCPVFRKENEFIIDMSGPEQCDLVWCRGLKETLEAVQALLSVCHTILRMRRLDHLTDPEGNKL